MCGRKASECGKFSSAYSGLRAKVKSGLQVVGNDLLHVGKPSTRAVRQGATEPLVIARASVSRDRAICDVPY